MNIQQKFARLDLSRFSDGGFSSAVVFKTAPVVPSIDLHLAPFCTDTEVAIIEEVQLAREHRELARTQRCTRKADADRSEKQRISDCAAAEHERLVVQQREANEAAQRLQRVTEQKANNERAKFEVEHRSFVDSFGAITGCSNVEVMRRFYSTYGNDTEKAVSAFFEFDGDVNKLPLPKPAVAKALVQSVSVGPSTVDAIPMFSSSSGSSPRTLKIDGSSPKSPPAAFSPSSIAVARAQGITLLQIQLPSGELLRLELPNSATLNMVHQRLMAHSASWNYAPLQLIQTNPQRTLTDAQLARNMSQLSMPFLTP